MATRAPRASTCLGLMTAAVGAVSATGWIAHLPVLTYVIPGHPAQKLLTAVLLLLAGAALAVPRRTLAVVLASVAGVLAVMVLLEYATGSDLGIDQLLVHDPSRAAYPGRPAPVNALAVLFACGLVLAGDARDRTRSLLRWSAMALLVGAWLVVILAFVFDADEVSARGRDLPLMSGLGVTTLALAALTRTAYEPPLAWLWDDGTRGALVRRLLPATLVAPPLLGWAAETGARNGLYSQQLAMLLFTTATTVMLTFATVAIGIAVGRAEQARDLLASELAATFDHLPAAMSLRDVEGRFLRANRMFEDHTGLRAEDVVGKSMAEVYSRRLLPWAQAEVEEVLATASPTHSEIETDLGKGPRVFDVTRYPVRDHDGRVIGLGTFTLDITDRKRAEQEAISAAARVEAFLAAAPDAMIVVDENGIIQFANAQIEPMLGYTVEEVVGQRVAMLVPDRVRDHHHVLREQYNANPTVRPMGGRGLTARHRDGHEVAVEISLGPAQTPDGHWTLAAIRDVTQRRADEEKVRAAEKRFREELDLAERIQRRLMPTDLPQPPGWDLAVSFTPASHVGGDFYDCWMPDHDLRVVVADVMGKGVSAALVGSGFRVTVNSALSSQEPAEAVRRVAHDMSADLNHTGRFVTCFAARIDPAGGAVRWVDAGHGLALVLRAGGGHTWLRGSDLPVGVLPDADWTEHVSAIEPGDMLVVVSDGLVDHFESADALLARIEREGPGSARDVLDALVEGLGEPSDDVTAFAIRREVVV